MYIYTHSQTYIYTHIHAYTHIHTHTHAYTHTKVSTKKPAGDELRTLFPRLISRSLLTIVGLFWQVSTKKPAVDELRTLFPRLITATPMALRQVSFDTGRSLLTHIVGLF